MSLSIAPLSHDMNLVSESVSTVTASVHSSRDIVDVFSGFTINCPAPLSTNITSPLMTGDMSPFVQVTG